MIALDGPDLIVPLIRYTPTFLKASHDFLSKAKSSLWCLEIPHYC